MTHATPVTATRGRATAVRRMMGLALVMLSPALVGCGARVFSGAPYTGDIEPRTVPRVAPEEPAAGTQAPATRAAPVEGVEEEAIEPPDDGFEVTVEPPEEVSEPLPAGPETPAEEAAPPIAPQSNAAPAAPAQPTVAAVSVEVPAPASPPRPASPGSFPNLADVPERPSDLPTAEERARVLAELKADQADALSVAGEAVE